MLADYAMTFAEWVEYQRLRFPGSIVSDECDREWRSSAGLIAVCRDCGFELTDGAVHNFVSRGLLECRKFGRDRSWSPAAVSEVIELLRAKDWSLTPLAAGCGFLGIRVIEYWRALDAAARAAEQEHGIRRIGLDPLKFSLTVTPRGYGRETPEVRFTIRQEYLDSRIDSESEAGE